MNPIFHRLTTLILAAVLALTALGQTSFKLITPGNVIAGRNFSLTFRLSNGQANAPVPPQLQGCEFLYGPSVSTMSSSQYINGKMSSSTTIDYTFMYHAVTPGKVSVPEVAINSSGKELKSSSAAFEILPPDQPSPSQGQQQQLPANPRTTRPTVDAVSANDIFVRVSFSKSHAYEQEAVLATIKVYTKFSITSFLVTQQPLFDGFLSEELPVDLEVNLENYNGQNYNTAVLKRLLLYPQKSGKLTVNSGKYDITIQQFELVNMGFFTTQRPVEKQITTESNHASIEIMPLPQPQPQGFTGAVGQFSVATDLQPELLRTNEAASYKYTIKGTGNIRYLKQPEIKFPSSVDCYTPKTTIDAKSNSSNTTGTYTVDYTIVPQEVGHLNIPEVPFVYFDVDKKQYVTLPTEAYHVKVLQGASTSAVVEQRQINKGISDILHIIPAHKVQTHAHTYYVQNPLYWVAYALAAVALIAAVIVYRRKLKFNADVKGKKTARANKVVNKRLKLARTLLKQQDYDKFYAELAKALWGYVSDKLAIAPSQLIRDNIAAQLSALGASQESVDDVLQVLDQCEMARFTPVNNATDASMVYQKAVDAIRNIEDIKK